MSDSRTVNDELQTFFSKEQQPFPDPTDGKIRTSQFLEASKCVVLLVEQFGKVFSPVRYDMNGNIQKITNKYSEDSDKFTYLNDMILCEQAEGGNLATDSLLWLRRALHFLHNFFLSVYEDTQENRKSEDLSGNIQKAYAETLEQYHGWMAKQLFKLLSRMVPSRTQLIMTLSLNQESIAEDRVFQDMDFFLKNMNSNINIIHEFYVQNGIESNAKCK